MKTFTKLTNEQAAALITTMVAAITGATLTHDADGRPHGFKLGEAEKIHISYDSFRRCTCLSCQSTSDHLVAIALVTRAPVVRMNRMASAKSSPFRYFGVPSRSARCESRPWRAQCAAAGKTYHLANFEAEEEAARAYDNIVHYLRDFGFGHPGVLNFPAEYAKSPPPMADTTRRVILDCAGRKGAHDPQRLHKSVARCLPLLRQIAAALPELEDALAGHATAPLEREETQSETPLTMPRT